MSKEMVAGSDADPRVDSSAMVIVSTEASRVDAERVVVEVASSAEGVTRVAEAAADLVAVVARTASPAITPPSMRTSSTTGTRLVLKISVRNTDTLIFLGEEQKKLQKEKLDRELEELVKQPAADQEQQQS